MSVDTPYQVAALAGWAVSIVIQLRGGDPLNTYALIMIIYLAAICAQLRAIRRQQESFKR